MNTTEQARAADRITDLLHRQAVEREELARQIEAEEVEQARSIVGQVREDSGRHLGDAIEHVEAQLRQDRRMGDLYAKEIFALPTWAGIGDLPTLGPEERREGRASVTIYVAPVRATDGRREPMAFALVDVSSVIFGEPAVVAREREAVEQAEVIAAEHERNRREAGARARRR